MSEVQKLLHIGVYGLIEKDNLILVIRKSRGPYKGLFDLPGGRPLHGEDLMDALSREIREETGLITKSYTLFGNFSYLVSYQDAKGKVEMHHIALTYRVNNVDFTNFNDSIVNEDVNGSLWISPHLLRKETSSPLLRSILKSYEE